MFPLIVYLRMVLSTRNVIRLGGTKNSHTVKFEKTEGRRRLVI